MKVLEDSFPFFYMIYVLSDDYVSFGNIDSGKVNFIIFF